VSKVRKKIKSHTAVTFNLQEMGVFATPAQPQPHLASTTLAIESNLELAIVVVIILLLLCTPFNHMPFFCPGWMDWLTKTQGPTPTPRLSQRQYKHRR
jgi:hypothetical protein